MSEAAKRIQAAVVAYAAGDAFGVAYEFEPPATQIANQLLGKDDWPAGGVSDDTLLSLMTIQSLDAGSPEAAATDFLRRLREAAPMLRGLGPTTRAALGLEVQPEYADQVGNTNGGMMRTALLGLSFAEAHERRAWVEASVRATHNSPNAVAAALSMSNLYAEVLVNPAEIDSIIKKYWLEHHPAAFVPEQPKSPVGLDPFETFDAVLAAAYRAGSVWAAFERACRFGGDTDTVCALAGALVALAWPESLAELKWLPAVNWHEIPQFDACVERLISKQNYREGQ